jgi:hypothetical protein
MLVGLGATGATSILLTARSWPAISAPWMVLLAALCLVFRKQRIKFGFTLGAVLLALFACTKFHQPVTQLHKSRNFFGPKCVVSDRDGLIYHTLYVGNTAHGMQWIDSQRHAMPTTYYDRTGPAGDIFRACSLRPGGPPSQVAIIGLGAGAMAAYATPGQSFTFYEIDPEIARIASDPSLFSFLRDCRGAAGVVLGDGRLTLTRAPDARYGLIMVDASTSDAIPTHLLTREALQLYLSKLDAHGLLAFHVTNRYVNLPPLLAALAQDQGLIHRYREDLSIAPADQANGKLPSQYFVLARRSEDLQSLGTNPRWRESATMKGVRAWSDQQTNIFRLLKW